MLKLSIYVKSCRSAIVTFASMLSEYITLKFSFSLLLSSHMLQNEQG